MADRDKSQSDVLRRVGSAIREARRGRQLSQEDLALACELDRTYIGGIERGERNLGVINLVLIARALRIPAADLLREIR